MPGFFSSVTERRTVTHGTAKFDLPILYYRDDLFLLFFSADFGRVKALMPSDKLHPVKMPSGRAMIAVAAFNYLETSIGPYGEVGVVLPAVYGKRPPLPVVPGLLEASYPNFGVLVLHLPVTKIVARDAGRGEWGYPKFVADMRFVNTPEYHQLEMGEDGSNIMTMRVMKKGVALRDSKPLITYTVKDRKLIKTTIPQIGMHRDAIMPSDSFLKLGDHPVAKSLKELDISNKPVLSRYFVERSGILPSGEVIEENVRPNEGYLGRDRKAEYTTVYEE